MFSRLLFRSSNCRLLTHFSSNLPFSSILSVSSHSPLRTKVSSPTFGSFFVSQRNFSSDRSNNDDENFKSQSWTLSSQGDDIDTVFRSPDGDLTGITEDIEAGGSSTKEIEDEWEMAEEFKPWSLGDEEEVEKVFDFGNQVMEGLPPVENEGLQEEARAKDLELEKEEEELKATLKGPNRAFGDLIVASGITEAMLDSLIVLKELEGIEGLPPLSEIEDIRLAKAEKKSTRAEIERKKQEEIAKTHIRQVDEKGRAYGTGRRKCSIARVWIQPGDGKFFVNDKQFDVYFPILDHRANLLQPFSETKTLGLWDVTCTVKGGGVSGQVGAVRLGISRALQNWEPGLRPSLRSAGFLTRDPRVVERKKPGKAKARKSFQWVKR
ncbi:small ribosomal subunit protein uS9m-like [Aristolochia californica]|uniref:small ribosomal subunit protein uS9m-like n=1 Tax=Aristolochia californica TaxID=171875 RepID=UPI0035D8A827